MVFHTPPRPGILLATLACLAAFILPSVQGASSDITVNTFRINNGEAITRSRTVTLNIDVSSSVGSITAMQLGDSVIGVFRNAQTYQTSLPYTMSGTANGNVLIAARFIDSKGNISPQASAFIRISPDCPNNLPALLTGTIPSMSILRGGSSSASLTQTVIDPADPTVLIGTNLGDIYLQLYPTQTPQTVANFLKYVENGNYDNTFFSRSVPGFVIQTGGYFIDGTNNDSITQVVNYGAVQNEPGLSNTAGTIAMAKLPDDPNSASNEWFVNLANNSSIIVDGTENGLDFQNGGFTVFGRVYESSMGVVNGIAALPTQNVTIPVILTGGGTSNIPFESLPVSGTDSNVQLQNLVITNPAVHLQTGFLIIQQPPGVKATIQNDVLSIVPVSPPTSGTGSIQIRGVAQDGRVLNFSVPVSIDTTHPLLNNGAGTKTVTTKEDVPIDISISVFNPGNSPLTWNLSTPTSGTCTLSGTGVNSGTVSVHYSPKANFSGTDSFTVSAKDTAGGQDTLTISVIVKPVNDLPTISAPTTVSVTGGTPSTFDITVGDAETPAADLQVTDSVNNSKIFPKGSITLSGAGATRTVHLSPSATTKIATATITLKVTDSNNGKRSAKVAVTVNP